MTVSEAALWMGIRRGSTGARFRRQVPIGYWIVDFASFDPKIVIEVDDASHDYRYERARTAYIELQGFTMLRFDNAAVRDDADAIVRFISQEVTRLR
jgi:BirA family biotin operon repressor/biotin-[acetyl-CoA-carboxylase] ligase